ncbi:MAG TPA: stage V sporulation protein AD [Candidatus Scybalomonas excrementigallinarum]|nr:stage V sporulation protein AD [Candidatus Scybalomonas excrementigallinarum]
MKQGKQSILFEKTPYIRSCASIVGKKEGEGPLAQFFDKIIDDPTFGEETWELAESRFQLEALSLALKKGKIKKEDLRYLFAGDLQGQITGTTFAMKDIGIPIFGLYGACSTMGESLSLAAMTVAAGYADEVGALTSSHLGSAEKNFRFPLEYGNQRPLSSTWTVTGSGAFIVSSSQGSVKIKGITTGVIKDYGVKDSMNMGAAMAPAAADVIYQNLQDMDWQPEEYDQIVTGDLGSVGREILIKLLKDNSYDISKIHMDCGMRIFDDETQDTHAGGSGCACSAVTLAGYCMDKLMKKEWHRILFVPTGALLSTMSFNEGQSVPGIAHAVILERQ